MGYLFQSACTHLQPVLNAPTPVLDSASATVHSLPPCAWHSTAPTYSVTNGVLSVLVKVIGAVLHEPTEMPKPPLMEQHRRWAVEVALRHSMPF